MRAQITHGHALGLCALDQATGRALVENNFQSMFLAEFVGEVARSGFEHLRLELVSLSHQLLENALRLPHERRADTQLAQPRTSQMEFVISKQSLEHGQQSARPGFFRRRCLCQQTQRFVLETYLDSVCAKRTLVLPEQTALGIFHDVE